MEHIAIEPDLLRRAERRHPKAYNEGDADAENECSDPRERIKLRTTSHISP